MNKIIIDCDPGVDDALAIFLALASAQEIEVLGLTCVKGNVALDKTFVNAKRICAAAGRGGIPVHRGIARPILDPIGIDTQVHGVDGLGDIGLPMPDASADTKVTAIEFILEQVNKYPGEVVLCPIGPMTNIAVALLLDPSLAQKVHSIVFMGGAAFCPGNMNEFSEFNFLVDPHAAQIVMQSGAPLVMFGLDVTHKAHIDPAFLNGLRRNENKCSDIALRLLEAYAVGDLNLHDPCVIAWLMDPQLFSGVQCEVSVVTDSGPEFGRSICNRQEDGNCHVILDLDHKRLFVLMRSRLAALR